MAQLSHEFRQQGIGSSDAPVLMLGKHFGKTPFDVWEEKVFGKISQKDNAFMKRGRDLEDTARQEFERLMSTCVVPKAVINPEKSWLRANLDGICFDDKILVEIKCPNQKDHETALKGMVPEKYYPQCQHQLAVTGLEGMYYFSFDGAEGVIVEVERDKDYLKKLLEVEETFWFENVLKKIPPDHEEKEEYFSLYPSKDLDQKESLLLEIRQQKKDLEKKETEIKEWFINSSQGQNCKGQKFLLTKKIQLGAIDFERLKLDFPNISFEDYRKPSFEKWDLRAMR